MSKQQESKMDISNDDTFETASITSGAFPIVTSSAFNNLQQQQEEKKLRESGVKALSASERRRLEAEVAELRQGKAAAEAAAKQLAAENSDLKADVAFAGIKSMSLGGTGEVKLGSTSAPADVHLGNTVKSIAAKIEALSVTAPIPDMDSQLAEAVHRDADILGRYLAGLDLGNPFTFGRTPVPGYRVAISTNADGKGVAAATYSRQLMLGRALALAQKFTVWHTEWSSICKELSQANQRVELLERNQDLQILKRQLGEASKEQARELSDTKRAADAKLAAAVATVAAENLAESKRLSQSGGLKRTSAAAKLEESRERAKKQKLSASGRI
jgi:hypothetical protein